MEEALADRADDSLTHLALKLTDFITYVMRQALPLFQADSEPIQDTLLDIQDTLLQRFGDMYDHSELQLHKKIWDVVNNDKNCARDGGRDKVTYVASHRSSSEKKRGNFQWKIKPGSTVTPCSVWIVLAVLIVIGSCRL